MPSMTLVMIWLRLSAAEAATILCFTMRLASTIIDTAARRKSSDGMMPVHPMMSHVKTIQITANRGSKVTKPIEYKY